MMTQIITTTGETIKIKHKNNEIEVNFLSGLVANDTVCEIIIADGIQKINGCAFEGFSNLEKVTLPTTLGFIGDFAFRNCKKLKSIEVVSDVHYVGEYAFGSCSSLEVVDLSKSSIKKVNTATFNHCDRLHSVTLPDNLQVIGDYAFSYCHSLKSIKIPKSVAGIDNYAFFNCVSLSDFNIPLKCTSVGKSAFTNTQYWLNADNYKDEILIKDGVVLNGSSFREKEFSFNGDKVVFADECFAENNKITCLSIGCKNVFVGKKAFNLATLKKVSIISGEDGFIVFNKKAFRSTRLTEVEIQTASLYINEKVFFSVLTMDKLKIQAKYFDVEDFGLSDLYIKEIEVNKGICATLTEDSISNITTDLITLKDGASSEILSVPDEDFLKYVLEELCVK